MPFIRNPFVLDINLFARALNNDGTIKGIQVDNQELKIVQYADNSSVFVQNQESVILELLNEFSAQSGLEINTSNSEVNVVNTMYDRCKQKHLDHKRHLLSWRKWPGLKEKPKGIKTHDY